MAPKRHRSYNPKEKLTIVRRAKEIGSRAAAKEFGVPEANVRYWRRTESNIEKIPKSKKRLGKRTAKWPQLESGLVDWIRQQRKEGRPVSRALTCMKARDMAREANLTDFTGTFSWCTRFMRRQNLSLRIKTSVGQKLPDDWEEKAEKFHSFIHNVVKSENIQPENIINMDEVPLSFDTPPNRTIDDKGVKSAFVRTTGHEKTNFTVVLACSATGIKLSPLLIFKRKTIPKEEFPDGVVIASNPKGWMTEEVMGQWLEKVFRNQSSATTKPKALLVLDSMRAHLSVNVKQAVEERNVKLAVIPGGLTKKLQPLDITINHVFKMEVRCQWELWMAEGIHSYTKSGHMRKANCSEVAQWIKHSWNSLKCSTIERAFQASGIIPRATAELDLSWNQAGASTSKEFPDATAEAASDVSFTSDCEENPDFFNWKRKAASSTVLILMRKRQSDVHIREFFNSDSDESVFLGFD